MPWGRLYGGTYKHRKVAILRETFPSDWRAWYVLIDLAIEVNDEGWIYAAPGVPYTIPALSRILGIKRHQTLSQFLQLLVNLDLIHVNGQGIYLQSFGDRNYISDCSTERVQKYREKRRQETLQQRDGNGIETPPDYRLQITEKQHTPRVPKPEKPKKGKRLKAELSPLPENFGISDRVRTWADEHGYGQLEDHLESFRLYAESGGKQYKDWDAAFMRAIKEDWGKIRQRKFTTNLPAVAEPKGFASLRVFNQRRKEQGNE